MERRIMRDSYYDHLIRVSCLSTTAMISNKCNTFDKIDNKYYLTICLNKTVSNVFELLASDNIEQFIQFVEQHVKTKIEKFKKTWSIIKRTLRNNKAVHGDTVLSSVS